MANTISVTIVGLGRVGASIGLALKRYNSKGNTPHTFEITGIEDRPGVLKDAEKLNAVDKIARNLYSAVENRDIVILTLAYSDVRRTYQAIADALRPGVVVMDFSPLKMPSIEWGKEYLSEEAHMVGMSPVVNPRYLYDGLDDTEHAAEDFFDKGSMLLMPAPNCIREAVELASDFSTLLGSTVHFADPMEYDTLAAATQGLPALLGVTTFYTLSRNAGWNDLQRVTNPPFGRLTHTLFDTHPDDLRDLWLNNRDSTVHYLDTLMDTLQQMRDALARNDQATVESVLAETSDKYSAWINRRHNNKWDQEDQGPKTPSTGETLMSGLMGGLLTRKLRGGSDDSK